MSYILNIYFQSKHKTDIKTSVMYYCGKPHTVTLDYVIDIGDGDIRYSMTNASNIIMKNLFFFNYSDFRLSYYPHRLDIFTEMVKNIFGHTAKYMMFGDFQPLNSIEDPAFYIHVVEKLK